MLSVFVRVITCFGVKFDKAETLVMDVLNLSSQLKGRQLSNAENAMGMMVAELYAQGYLEEALQFFALLAEKYPKFRLYPGRQLLWARIAAQSGRGMEALKKLTGLWKHFLTTAKKSG